MDTARNPRGQKLEFNMTPMIDIVFNLIIFFMLMPSMEAKEGYLPTNLPKTMGNEETVKKPEGYNIQLDHINSDKVEDEAKCEIYFNDTLLANNQALRDSLKNAYIDLKARQTPEELKKMPVIIKPDMMVWHKHVVAAFDAAVDAGFSNIMFSVPR
jgi:biopolymer transport protein ExbD